MKGGSKHKKMMKKAVHGNLVLFGTQGQQQEDEGVEEGDGEEEEIKQKDRKKRKRVEYSEYWWRLKILTKFGGLLHVIRM